MLVMSIVMMFSGLLIELMVMMFPLRCPGLCSCGCWSCFQGEKSDLESTKILTVRFSSKIEIMHCCGRCFSFAVMFKILSIISQGQ